jgi:hypothetical protein
LISKNGERNEREIDVSITLVNQTKPADADAQKARRISRRAVGSKINVASTAATKRRGPIELIKRVRNAPRFTSSRRPSRSPAPS